MDVSSILQRLERRIPIFTTWPETNLPRVGGDESELGILDENGKPEAEWTRVPFITDNGGCIGTDVGHIEYRTPESSNPVERVAYGEAMKQLCFEGRYAHKMYCHCLDGKGNCFGGSHENYFTCAQRSDWPSLIPFLIARTLFAGTGTWVEQGGAPIPHISERAGFITTDVSEQTTTNRGIINTRIEELAKVKGWDRMHLIYSEPTMCEVATFLRTGLMSLVIKMMEMDALPPLRYDRNKATSDLHRLSSQMCDWYLEGVTKGPKGAVDLLGLYVRRARELFWGQDAINNAIIVIAMDTLHKLASNPSKLFGRLDWVTKFEILRLLREEFPGDIKKDEFGWLMSQGMEWHNLNPDEGFYYALRQTREVERIVSDELIEEVMRGPRPTTRTYVRGMTQKLLKEEGKGRELLCNEWEKLIVVNANFNRKDEPLVIPGNYDRVYWEEGVPNPFDPNQKLLEKIRARIARGE